MKEMYELNNMLQKVNDFQKTMVNTSFNAMSILQTRTEKITDMYLNQFMWGSEKWKDAFAAWFKFLEESCESLKKTMYAGLSKIETRLETKSDKE